MSAVRPLFLFSQPRAGSTLLQRMLGAHPAVHTVAEPWVLLPLFYALRRGGAVTEYGQPLTAQAIREFCEPIEGGVGAYYEEARAMALRLYDRAAPEGSVYFLDKTPRYYFIASEIVRTFTDARFVFLWRQPLASAASMISRWGKGGWSTYTVHNDLYAAPGLLTKARELAKSEAGDRALDVRYEDLITEPERTLDGLLAYLELETDEATRDAMVHGFSGVELSGSMGDPTGRKAYDALDTAPLEKWKQSITNRTRKRWCAEYLDEIGDGVVSAMGYDPDDLRAQARAIKPRGRRAVRDWARLKADALMVGARGSILGAPGKRTLVSAVKKGLGR